jgi:hypothetical protein
LWTTGTFRTDHHDDGASSAGSGASTVGRARYLGAFKTPTLRELTRTAPYFQDGSVSVLREIVDFYNAGGIRQDGLGYALSDKGHDIVAEEINRKLGLSGGDISDLVTYLTALTATSVDNGPVGLDQAPSVVITQIMTGLTPGGAVISKTIYAQVTDPDGASDLDPSMDWTLDVEVGGIAHHWSETSRESITNGYSFILTVSPVPSNPDIHVRAADHHGRWGAWAYP